MRGDSDVAWAQSWPLSMIKTLGKEARDPCDPIAMPMSQPPLQLQAQTLAPENVAGSVGKQDTGAERPPIPLSFNDLGAKSV